MVCLQIGRLGRTRGSRSPPKHPRPAPCARALALALAEPPIDRPRARAVPRSPLASQARPPLPSLPRAHHSPRKRAPFPLVSRRNQPPRTKLPVIILVCSPGFALLCFLRAASAGTLPTNDWPLPPAQLAALTLSPLRRAGQGAKNGRHGGGREDQGCPSQAKT